MREVAPGATPGIGLWPGVPAEEYHAWDAASNSRLTRLLRSPAHLRAYMDEQPERTPALVLGDAIHKAILEPDLFPRLYAVAGQCAATIGSGKRCINPGTVQRGDEWFCGVKSHDPGGANGKRTSVVLDPDDWKTCLAVRDSVWRHPAAAKLLRAAEHVEASAVWRDEDAGVLCKARADALVPEFGTVVDI
jgi:exodeoxyribonuclease VIII